MEQSSTITEQSSSSMETSVETTKIQSRRRKPLRPCPLSSRVERNKSESFSPLTTDELHPLSCEDRRTNLIETKSNKSKIHRCRQCSFISHSKEEYWTHHRVHIRTEKILECPSCPFVTEYKHHLEYHLRNHLGSKPFKCSKCEYACVNLSMLRSHKKSHYRHLIFKCSDCHQLHHDEQIEEFLQEYFSTILPKRKKTSQRVSSPDEISLSLVCHLCDYRAESKEYLNVHLFQHTIDRSFITNPIQQWIEFVREHSANIEQCNTNSTSTSFSSIDQQTQVDQWQLQGLFECSHCQMIFKDFSMYCTHKQFHSSTTNPFRCAQCGEQKINQYDFFVHITQQAHDLS